VLERSRAAGDKEAARVLEAMEAEHGEIDPLLAACGADLAVLADRADDDARAALEIRLVGAAERLGTHLAHEERDALRLVQQHLSEQDWERVEQEHFVRTATLRYLAFVVPWVLHELPLSARREVQSGPGRVLVVLGPLLRVPFLRLERAAFRYV
jgi:hypothetical protein